ncbi:hypothetical protein P8A20_07725 [Streptomyces glycanivorans]|uniref:Uncharacterized protein n=1 Tax=Streptomyces glycanivorans TaxID=3033808 RepID=A0ABY9JS88_9ACTN|nr:hypothetical protein [Streptomyces sp. Alt3]WLQ68877.1 hypothetical protein P8A20_07725 [Streptomyces sp. Alt3]
MRTDRPDTGSLARGRPHLGPSWLGAAVPDGAPPHSGQPSGGDRPPVLRHRHRPRGNAHRAGRGVRRDRLAREEHPLGHHRMGSLQHGL